MQAGFEPEALRSEPRFHPDTVQKAVALAQQLEQERRETLSLAQVNQLAEELNLDPVVLQQALARVSADEARQARVKTTPVVAQQNRPGRILIALGFAFFLAIALLLFGYVSVREVPAPATVVPVQPEVAPAPPSPIQPPVSPTPPPAPNATVPQIEGR